MAKGNKKRQYLVECGVCKTSIRMGFDDRSTILSMLGRIRDWHEKKAAPCHRVNGVGFVGIPRLEIDE